MLKARSSAAALVGFTALLAGTLGFFGALPAQASNPTLTGTTVTIADGPGDSTDPHVSGDWVTYTNDGTGLDQVDYYNLATAVSASIDNNGGNDSLSGISGTSVVYTHVDTSGNYSIDAYDIGSGNPPTALSQPGDVADDSAIGGDTVAWVEFDCTSSSPGCDSNVSPSTPQIMVYDTATQTVTDVSDNPATANLEPSVSPDGSVVTWVECELSGSPCDVWDATIGSDGTWTANQLTDGAASGVDSEQPHTDGTIVTYSSTSSGVEGIYWQPVGGGTVQQVPVPAGYSTLSDPHTSGGLISFEAAESSGLSAIFVYSLATQADYQVTSAAGVNQLDDISVSPAGAANVVWESLVSGQYNIYGFSFQVPQAAQSISITAPATGVYGGSATLAATGGGSGNPVTFSVDPSSGAGVCTVSGDTVSYTGAGSCVIDASQAGDVDYTAGIASTEITVDPAPLTVTASSGSMTYGGTPPSITASYSGFVNGDTTASLTTAPTCTTTATSASPAGSYPSSCAGAADPNYAISYVSGSVTVGQAQLTITASSPSMTYGAAAPPITASYAGFVNGDTTTSLTTSPTCTTTATSASPVGSYPSTCSGAADPNYAISYVSGSVTVTQASTALSYTGPQSISAGASLVPTASLTSSATACQASQPVSFTLGTDPLTGATGTYSLESATTSASGTATGASISTSGWQAGAYTITASYAGTGNCSASTATAPLVVTVPGLAAAGAGSYPVAGVGTVSFGFIVAQIPHTSSYLGGISLVSPGSWRLAGILSSYSTSSSTEGTVTGSGSLYWWNESLNNGHGGWQLAKAGVAFTAGFTATTKTSAGSFGIQISYTPVSPQPSTLPNSSPVSLESGAVVMAA